MRKILNVAIKELKIIIKTKEILFWNIVFPIVMMLLFTSIFGNSKGFTSNIGILDRDHSDLSNNFINILQSINGTSISLYEDNKTLFQKIMKHEFDAYIIIPEGFEYNVTHGLKVKLILYVDKTNPQTASIARGLIEGVVNEFNRETRSFYLDFIKKQGTYINETIIERIETFGEPLGLSVSYVKGTEEISYKEYMFTGVIGYGFLFSSMATATGIIVKEKSLKTIKRIKLTPIKPIELLLGKTIGVIINTYLYEIIVFAIALTLLKPIIHLLPIDLIIVITLGSLIGISIGLIISILFKTPEGANGFAIIIGIFSQFLIGLYFPIEWLPPYLQRITYYYPFTYVTLLVRDVVFFGETIVNNLASISILIITIVLLYSLGSFLYQIIINREEI